MRNLKTVVVVAMLLLLPNAMVAQNECSIEIRPRLNFATEDLGDANLKTGAGIEAVFSYNFMEHLGAYVGWGFNTFTADNSFAGSNVDFDETGYTFGLQFIHPIGESSFSYLIRAGGIYSHIEVESDGGNSLDDSEHGLGYEFGAGLAIDLGSDWSLRPQVGYHALSRDITIDIAAVDESPINSITRDVDLNYIVVAVGIAKTF